MEQFLRHLLEPSSGTRLPQDEYLRDFEARLWLADGADSWKFERMQFYDETGFPSWDAFAAGDWERSLELYQDLRPELLAFNRPVPELVSLCGATLYLTVYDAPARPDGGKRFTGPDIIARYEAFVRDLCESGEDLQAYFEREIAPLPPPSWPS